MNNLFASEFNLPHYALATKAQVRYIRMQMLTTPPGAAGPVVATQIEVSKFDELRGMISTHAHEMTYAQAFDLVGKGLDVFGIGR